ncbi:FecR family protein [Pedobacter sp. L105]|uniref:FecR family protein n=1 Tax=Pedobacter sp. L105 TaxID=1641871 RepID=UPI00131E7F58|nr:FecR family protein [Pedobacter sp. L105]
MESEGPKYEITELANKWLKGTITPEEKAYYEKWYGAFDDSETNFQYGKSQSAKQLGDKIYAVLYDRIQETKELGNKKHVLLRWTAIAASILFFLSFGAYFLVNKKEQLQIAHYKNDILPGHNQATLTLANGQKIILGKGLSGTLAQQGNTLIVINGKNTISYNAMDKKANVAISYNTLSTVVGEQSPYPLILADGTKVWLNAKSSITFPVAFTGKERMVKITGEAYFEVAHNSAHPFRVIVKNQTVEDIGTQFNINAYDDENVIKTTLLEGAVKVFVPTASTSARKDQVLLKPGEQAILNHDEFNVANADVEETMAWKKGYFRFNNENIQSIMRKLSRWYDIDVQYTGTISDEKYYATSSRYKSISEVLKMLEKTKGVHFKIEGRRVTVMQ